jgi:DNA modification methylase
MVGQGNQFEATELGGSAGRLYRGDCLDVLPTLGENTADALVTDPP